MNTQPYSSQLPRVVRREGRITGEFDPDSVTSQELGSAMTGAGKDAS